MSKSILAWVMNTPVSTCCGQAECACSRWREVQGSIPDPKSVTWESATKDIANALDEEEERDTLRLSDALFIPRWDFSEDRMINNAELESINLDHEMIGEDDILPLPSMTFEKEKKTKKLPF